MMPIIDLKRNDADTRSSPDDEESDDDSSGLIDGENRTTTKTLDFRVCPVLKRRTSPDAAHHLRRPLPGLPKPTAKQWGPIAFSWESA